MRYYIVKKDRYRRRLFLKYERKKLIYKFLRLQYRNNPEKSVYYSRLLSYLPKDSSISRIRNYCILSNRARGVYSDFKLSRMFIKKLSGLGMLNGVKRASW